MRGLASAGAEVVGRRRRAGDRPGGVPARRASAGGTDLVLSPGRADGSLRATRRTGNTTWLGRDGQAWAVAEAAPAPLRGTRAAAADGTVRSPMPGTVVAVHVTVGQAVSAGQPVLVVEAMKMEHTVTAPLDGTVTELTAKAGQQVRMDEPLAVIGPEARRDGGSVGRTPECALTVHRSASDGGEE